MKSLLSTETRNSNLSPPVDVHHLSDRAEAVRRIDVSALGAVVLEPPHVPIQFLGEVVSHLAGVVGAVAVHHFAEESLPRHVQRHDLKRQIAVVLHHLAMLPRPLGRLDQLPALLDGPGRRHFRGDVFAVIHRVNGHRRVHVPRRRHEHQVNVVTLANPFPIFRTGEDIRVVCRPG